MSKFKSIKYLIIFFVVCLLLTTNTFSFTQSVLVNVTLLRPPVYGKVRIPDVESKLYVNIGITGKVVVAREVESDGSLGAKYSFDFKKINENWAELIFQKPVNSFNEVVLLGSTENILLSKSKSGEGIVLYKDGTSTGKFVVRFGTANETIHFPDFDIKDIESVDVSIADEKGDEIRGNAIVASDRLLVLQFKGITPEFLENGHLRLVLRFRSKLLLVDLDSWGYDFDVSKTYNTKKHLTSNIYGLNPDNKIRIYYEVREGQTVETTAEIFTVKELNEGKTFAIIENNKSPIKLDFVLEE